MFNVKSNTSFNNNSFKVDSIIQMHETMTRLYQAAKELKGIVGQSALAAFLNDSPQTLNNWESRGISKNGMLKAQERIGCLMFWLQTGKGAMTPDGITSEPIQIQIESQSDFIAVKRADFKLSAGVTGYSIELLNGDRAPIFFRKDWLDKRGYIADRLYAIEISGDSMQTSMYDGDIVVVNLDDTNPIDGEVFAANYEGELVIKRMIRENGTWYLSSDNQDKRRFPNKQCHEDCFIIGRVIYKQSERI